MSRLIVLTLCVCSSLLTNHSARADEIFSRDTTTPEQKAEALTDLIADDLERLAELRKKRQQKFDLNNIPAYGEFNRLSDQAHKELEKKLALNFFIFLRERRDELSKPGDQISGSSPNGISPQLRKILERTWTDLKAEFEITESELNALKNHLNEFSEKMKPEALRELKEEIRIKEQFLKKNKPQYDQINNWFFNLSEPAPPLPLSRDQPRQRLAIARSLSRDPEFLLLDEPYSQPRQGFTLNISELFITGGGLDQAYRQGVKTSLTRKIPLFDFDNATVHTQFGFEHSTLFREDVNVNPIPGVNHITVGNAQTYGGVVGTGIRIHEFDLFEGLPILSERRRPLPFLDIDLNLGVGGFHQDLSPQLFNGMNPTITRGPGTPRGDGPYVSGEVKTKLGFGNREANIGITGGYFLLGTDAVDDGWTTTKGFSAGIEAEISLNRLRRLRTQRMRGAFGSWFFF